MPSVVWQTSRGRNWVRKSRRQVAAGWRDTLLLLREFRRPLLYFILVMLAGALLYDFLLQLSGAESMGLVKTVYFLLTLTFFQAGVDNFPSVRYLQVFYFLMPVVGISILAQGLTDFSVLLFNRRARGKEWEMAVASTYNNHVVLVGLGHLGFRVVKTLIDLNQDVVAIERAPEAEMLHKVRALNVSVLVDDGTRDTVLISAGVPRARAIILCTQNDSLNLRMALKARSLNPKIEVVIRIFDDDFAGSLQTQFGFHAMSATGMAAPLFAATAAHIDITPPVTIDGQPLIMAQLPVEARSLFRGSTVSELEEKYRISVILLCKDGQRNFHPAGDEVIQLGQTIAVFGEPDRINLLIYERTR